MNDEIKLDLTVKGTRIITGELAKKRRSIINTCINQVESNGFSEIVLPLLERQMVYIDKAGPEILGQMYTFQDKSGRELCLRPEGTATCQLLASEVLKYKRDVKLWYVTNCYRYEQPQSGRYREFTQFGIEWLNPTNISNTLDECKALSHQIMDEITDNWEFMPSVKRGLAYYTENGFEIICNELGAQKQVCGGGIYKEGVGFAFGIDRLMLLK